MSTPSIIAIQNNNGEYDAIYCHADGFLTCVGRTLNNRYQDKTKIRKLINLGDLSWLGNEPFDPGDLWTILPKIIGETNADRKKKLEKHYYDPDYTRTYTSRGDHKNIRHYKTVADMYHEYGRVYVWDEKNGWRVKNSKRRHMKVSNALKTANPTE